MILQTLITEDWAMVRAEGSLDIAYADSLLDAARVILRSGIPNIKLDLEKVDYISSAGVRALFMLRKETENEPGVDICIVNCSRFVSGVLKMAGLQILFAEEEIQISAQPMQRLLCEFKTFPQWSELNMEGAVNVFSSTWLVEAVRDFIAKGGRHLRLNARDVKYISSSGIRALLMIYREISSAQGSVRIIDPSPEFITVLKLAGLDTVLLS